MYSTEQPHGPQLIVGEVEGEMESKSHKEGYGYEQIYEVS